MSARLAASGEPIKLAGNRLVFTNWAFVNQGGFSWLDETGKTVNVIGHQDALSSTFRAANSSPRGVRLTAFPARKEGPILRPKAPWEESSVLGTLIRDGGVYKGWFNTGWGDLHLARPGLRGTNAICYCESNDGWEWKPVVCGNYEWEGSRHNNIVISTACFVGGGCSVFVDETDPGPARYKMTMEWLEWERDTIASYKAKWPSDVDGRSERSDISKWLGVRGAISSDGINWVPIEEPLILTHCDTQPVLTYDSSTGEYVLYTRDYADLPAYSRENRSSRQNSNWVATSRRAIGMTVSESFDHFPLPRVVLEARLEMLPSEVLYTNCYTTIPQAPDHHLMFPAVWDLARNDRTWITMASSRDGRLWQYVPNGRMLETGHFGEWDGGCVYAHPNLVELPGGDWVLAYTGFNVPHKYPRVMATRDSGYAVWPKGRLMAIEAPDLGSFQTLAIVPPASKLFINALTPRAGSITVEACGVDGQPIPGRSFGESSALMGDVHWKQVTWSEHSDIGICAGDGCVLRFRMDQAQIFGLEFR